MGSIYVLLTTKWTHTGVISSRRQLHSRYLNVHQTGPICRYVYIHSSKLYMKRMGKKKHPNHPNIMTLHDSFWFLPERWKQKNTQSSDTWICPNKSDGKIINIQRLTTAVFHFPVKTTILEFLPIQTTIYHLGYFLSPSKPPVWGKSILVRSTLPTPPV
jgi:hypothetical protein